MRDMALRQNIIDELEFEPSIDAADIGVAVDSGVVTLTGHVPSYFQKIEVENVVSRVGAYAASLRKSRCAPLGPTRRRMTKSPSGR